MRVIDAHAHVIERIAGFGARGELRPLGGGRAAWANGDQIQLIPASLGDRSFTGETLVGLLDRHGVEKAVLLQGSFYGFQNDYSREIEKAYPGRFAMAGTLDPFCREREGLLQRLLGEMSVRIMKFEVSSGGGIMSYHEDFDLDGPVFAPVIERIASADATLVLDIGKPGSESFQPDAVARIAARWPALRIVVCHLLAPRLGDEEILKDSLGRLKRDNVWFDLAAVPWNVSPEPYPYPTGQRYVALARDIVGSEKLLWGSDVPCPLTRESYSRLMDYLSESRIFTEGQLEGVFHDNACEAYPSLKMGA